MDRKIKMIFVKYATVPDNEYVVGMLNGHLVLDKAYNMSKAI